jgi:ParB-like chromosome segregation protein Spo0J
MTTPDPYQLLPDLDAAEFTALKADVALRGVLVPVEVDDAGAVLDGHHRLRAWTELREEGVKVPDYPRVVRRFDDEEDKVAHVLALNLARRHLGAEQRARLVADLRTRGWSNRRIAGVLGVDEITVRRDAKAGATFVAPEKVVGADGRSYPAERPKAPPSIVVASARDEGRARSALTVLGEAAPGRLLGLTRAEGQARAAHLAQRRQDAVAAVTNGPLWRIEHIDFRELDVPDQSVDAIICDPPYNDEAIPLWSDLSAFAARVLKPGHPIAAYCGHLRQPETMARLGEQLEFVWVGATVLRGRHTKVHVRKVNGWHRPWLVYSAGPYRPRGWIHDTLVAEGRGEKDLTDHPWRQAEGPFRELVRMLTFSGELVVDPFVGQGTTAAAAVAEGRRFLGCDRDPAAVSLTVERLEAQDHDINEAKEAP